MARGKRGKRRFIDDAANESDGAGGTAADGGSGSENEEEQETEADRAFINDSSLSSEAAEPAERVRISRREKRITNEDRALILENVGDAEPALHDRPRRHVVYKDSDESDVCSSDEDFVVADSSEEEEERRQARKKKKRVPAVSSAAPVPAAPAASAAPVPATRTASAAPVPATRTASAATKAQTTDFDEFYSEQPDEAPAEVKLPPAAPALTRPPSIISRPSLAPAAKAFTFPGRKKPTEPAGRVKPMPATRVVAPIFQKGHKPLPPPPKAAAKKRGGVFDEPQAGIYIRNGQLFYKRADGTEEPRSWAP
jgi:hypothetical protein